jgi:hypothetical protein
MSQYRDLWVGDFIVEETKTLDVQICSHPMVAVNAQLPVSVSAADAHVGYLLGPAGAHLDTDRESKTTVRYSQVRPAPETHDHTHVKHYGQYAISNARMGLNLTYISCWQHEEDIKGKAGLIAEDCWNMTSTTPTPTSASTSPNTTLNSPLGGPLNATLDTANTTAQPAFPHPLSNSIILPVSYGTSPRLTLTYFNTYAPNTGCIRVHTVRLTDNAPVHQALSSFHTGMLPTARDAVLAGLPWAEINWMDAKRLTNNEFEKLSLSMIHTFIPEPAQYSARSFQYGRLANPDLLRPNCSYLVKITQIDANAEAIANINEKQGRGGKRTSPQKFKLYSVTSC